MQSLLSPWRVRLPFTVPLVLRYLLITLLLTGFVLGCWSSITPVAHAATHAAAAPRHAHQTDSQQQPLVAQAPGTPRHPTFRPAAGSSVNQLGLLPFYTYISLPLTDHLSLHVNVASGNLVLESDELTIQGTGLSLAMQGFYNALASDSLSYHLGKHWVLAPAPDVFLHVNSDGSVDDHGPSGYTATFTKNSDGSYNDAPGLDATLTLSGGQYQLTFHQSKDVWTFASTGDPLSERDAFHNTLTFNRGSITDTQGRTISVTSLNNSITKISDPTGRSAQFGYTSGLLTSQSDLGGKTTTYGYLTGTNLLTSITDALGQGTSIAYDSRTHRVLSFTDATGAKTSFDYNTPSMVTDVTDANGHVTTYDWDSAGRVTKIIDALGHSTSVSYTADDKPAQVTDAVGVQTSYSYDSNNNLTQVQNTGTGETASWNYVDPINPFLPTAQTDPQKNVYQYTYDSRGDLLKVQNKTISGLLVTMATYSYNNNGTLSGITDANGHVTRYGYDAHGNQTSITHPSPLGSESFTYDSVSRVSTSTDGLGQQTSDTYDNLDRVTKLTYAGGISVSSVYDADGNLTSMTDPTGTTSYTYDKVNRVLTKTLPGGTQLTYTYDPVGNLLTFTDGGGTVSYGYNQVNELVTLTEPGGAKTSFGYDAKGQRTSTSYPNGVVMSVSYDQAGHETTVTATHGSSTLVNLRYDYVTSDLLLGTLDNVAQTNTIYTYDTLNRLTEASVAQGGTQVNDFKYKYDLAGNLTSSTLGKGATPTSYTYNAANELTSSTHGSTNLTYSYDADGNLSGWSSGGLSFSYNSLNQTTAISGNTYRYSGSDQTDRVQANSTSYVYSFNGISSQTDSSGTTYYTRCSCAKGTLVDERTPAGAYYYLFDGLGSIVGLTDSNGTLVSTYQYDPYGNLLSSTGSVANPWRFAGGYFDSSTGLYKFGTRYYNPGFGRWSQQDPLRGQLNDPTSLNRYLYAGDDPVNFTDPSGSCTWTYFYAYLFTAIGVSIIEVAGIIILILAVIAAITATGGPFGIPVLLAAISTVYAANTLLFWELFGGLFVAVGAWIFLIGCWNELHS